MLPMARHRASKVRAPAARRCALSLENAISPFDKLRRVEVGTVGRQEQEPGAMVPEDADGLGVSVNGEVVEHDDVTPGQGRGELGLDPQVKGGAIHRFVDDPWRAEPIAAQVGDEEPVLAHAGICVCQWPNGAALGSREPRGERPRSRTILVVTAVSSTNTSRAGWSRIRSWRWVIQHRRASATAARSRSAAARAFFHMRSRAGTGSATGRPARRRRRAPRPVGRVARAWYGQCRALP